MSAPAPYAGLTPDRILDALDGVGIAGDGRLLALNSYENRVYLVYRDGDAAVVAKFYRPARWSDEQIGEEHAFTAELAAREIPVIAPMTLANRTLHRFAGFRFAVYPRQGGRTPELDDRATPPHAGGVGEHRPERVEALLGPALLEEAEERVGEHHDPDDDRVLQVAHCRGEDRRADEDQDQEAAELVEEAQVRRARGRGDEAVGTVGRQAVLGLRRIEADGRHDGVAGRRGRARRRRSVGHVGGNGGHVGSVGFGAEGLSRRVPGHGRPVVSGAGAP